MKGVGEPCAREPHARGCGDDSIERDQQAVASAPLRSDVDLGQLSSRDLEIVTRLMAGARLSAGDCCFYDKGRWELYVATCGVVVLDRPGYILS